MAFHWSLAMLISKGRGWWVEAIIEAGYVTFTLTQQPQTYT